MRPLFVSTLFGAEWGASEVLWTSAATESLARGATVLADVPSRAPAWIQLDRGGAKVRFRTDAWRPSRLQRARRRMPFELQPVTRWLDALPPDVVLLNHGSAHDVLADPGVIAEVTNWCRRRTVPYLPLVSGNDHARQLNAIGKARAAEYYAGAFLTLFVSFGNWRALEAQVGTTIAGRVIRSAVADVGAVPWPKSDARELASVGRLDMATKGQDLLIAALARQATDDWRLTCYGDGPDLDSIKALIPSRLSAQVTFAGHKPVSEIWRRCQLLVMPSRVEGASIALSEAMLAGRPVVATDVGGAAEWIDPGETGWIASTATVDDVSQAIEVALAASEHWPDMGLSARERALTLIDSDPTGTLLKILEDASEGVRPQATSRT